MSNFEIVELIIDMIVNSTVNNRQLNTLSLVIYMEIETFSLTVRRLISVFLGVFRNTPPSLHPHSVRADLLLIVFSS